MFGFGLSPEQQSLALQLEQGLTQLSQHSPLFSLHARVAFELGERLGEGGMGAVHRVIDKRLGRHAAIKFLHSQEPKPELYERFVREAQLMAQLDHPAIPPIYEAGLSLENQLFMLMKVIDGETLSQRLQSSPPSLESVPEALQMFVKICEAVAYAHSRGIIHRDLKPENIMIGSFGEVMVMDWGLARRLDDSDWDQQLSVTLGHGLKPDTGSGHLTQAGSFLGTAGYAAPEQIDGDFVDERADVFALAALLVEMLTHRPAVKGGDFASKLMATRAGEFVRPSDELSVGSELDWIVAQGMALDPEKRTASVELMARQVKALLSLQPIPGAPSSRLGALRRSFKRAPGFWLAGFSGLCLLALGPALWFRLDSEQQRLRARDLSNQLQLEAQQRARDQAERQARISAEKLRLTRLSEQRLKRVLRFFNEARDLSLRGAHKDKIEDTLKAALSLSSRSEEALLTAGDIAKQAGLQALAQDLFQEAADRFPPAYRALFQLHLLESKAEFQFFTPSLETLIRRASAQKDENEFTLYSEGVRHFHDKNYKAALQCYDKIEDYTTGFYWLYINRGVVKVQLKRLPEAIKDYDQAAKLNPRMPHAYYNRANANTQLRRYERALSDYQRAIELRPDHYAAYTNRGLVYEQQGQYQKALKDYDEALKHNPKDSATYSNRGLIYKRLNQPRRALADFGKALDLDPKNERGYYNRAHLYYSQGQYAPCLDDLNEALKWAPDLTQAYFLRAACKHAQRRWQAAFDDYSEVIKRDPQNAQAFCGRGQCLLYLNKDAEAAIGDLSKALSLDSTQSTAYISRGVLLRRKGEKQAAIYDFQQFLKRQPQHPDAPMIRGWIKDLKGQ